MSKVTQLVNDKASDRTLACLIPTLIILETLDYISLTIVTRDMVPTESHFVVNDPAYLQSTLWTLWEATWGASHLVSFL